MIRAIVLKGQLELTEVDCVLGQYIKIATFEYRVSSDSTPLQNV